MAGCPRISPTTWGNPLNSQPGTARAAATGSEKLTSERRSPRSRRHSSKNSGNASNNGTLQVQARASHNPASSRYSSQHERYQYQREVVDHEAVAELDGAVLEGSPVPHADGSVAVRTLGVPDEVLFKPGKLTEEETAQAQKHPEYGWAILQSVPGFERASLLVLHHHERYDGKGYPAGLAGEETPLGSRIVAVVDAYDAMISDRAYRKGLPHEEAVRRLKADSGTQFDPNVTPLFISMTNQTKEAAAGFDEEIPSFTLPLASSQK